MSMGGVSILYLEVKPTMIDDIFLKKCREEGDAVIDEFLNQYATEVGKKGLQPLFEWCKNAKDLNTAILPLPLQEHFALFNQLPSFADTQQIQEGIQFFKKYVAPIAMLLGCYSLPYCYMGEDGARVLYFSEKIHQNTTQRLNDTGDFVREMHELNNWHSGENFVRAYKVRLMHGLIRYFLKTSGQWNMDWGIPLNQEDKTGTNLAFSHIVIKGLKKLNIEVSNEQYEAYLHTWKIIGYLMGVKAELLVNTADEAEQLDQQIAKRNFRESDIGKFLAKSLIDSSRSVIKIPFLKEMPTAIMREMLGDTMANQLNIPELPIHQKFVRILPFRLMVRNSRVVKASA